MKKAEKREGSKHSEAATESFTEILLLILLGITQKIFLESKIFLDCTTVFQWDLGWGLGQWK